MTEKEREKLKKEAKEAMERLTPAIAAYTARMDKMVAEFLAQEEELATALAIAIDFNRWRRGEDNEIVHSPTQIGQSIDELIEAGKERLTQMIANRQNWNKR
jgi:hypothetical protein